MTDTNVTTPETLLSWSDIESEPNFIGLDAVAKHLGISRSTVERNLNALRKAGAYRKNRRWIVPASALSAIDANPTTKPETRQAAKPNDNDLRETIEKLERQIELLEKRVEALQEVRLEQNLTLERVAEVIGISLETQQELSAGYAENTRDIARLASRQRSLVRRVFLDRLSRTTKETHHAS